MTQAFPGTSDDRTVEDVDRHIKEANAVLPPLLTDEQIAEHIVACKVMDQAWPTQREITAFARAIESEVRTAIAAAGGGVPQGWRETMRALVNHIERHTCMHEETYRGGTIWEICRACGAKWADDEGGKPEYQTPEYLERAYELLASSPQPEAAPAVVQVPQGWKLVPVEPTREMLSAGTKARTPFRGMHHMQSEEVFKAMLAAAPEAPAQADPLEKLTRLQEEMGLYDEAPAQAEPMRTYVESFALSAGWDRAGKEGAFEFVQRKCYHQGWQDGRREGAGDVHREIPEAPAQAELTGCSCRWDKDDNRVQTCARHQGWLDVVHEWAARAKDAEWKLTLALEAPPQGKPDRTGMTYYKNNDCKAASADDVDCICWTPAQAAPSAGEVEQRVREFERLLEHLIDIDPDRAERFIESTLAQLALKKRLEEKRAAISHKEQQP